MKKLLSILILSLITLACAFGLVACGECEHSFTNYLSDNNATCLEDGTKTATCNREDCEETDTVTDIDSKLGHKFTNYVSDNNATYEADGTKTAICDRENCEETDTIVDTGSKLESKVIYDFEIVDGVANITVANEVEEYDFNTVITSVGLKGYIVGLDKNGTQTSLTKKVDLVEGDNTFYIFETSNNQIIKTTKVIIHRVQYGTIKIVYNNGLQDKIIKQEYDSAITEVLPTNLDKPGYSFNGFDKEMPEKMPLGNLTITAKWEKVFVLNGGEITDLTSHGRTLSKIVIPENIDGVKITSIGDYAFYWNYSLADVSIPKTINNIGDFVFCGSSLLASISVAEENEYYRSIDGNLYSEDGKTLIKYAIGKSATEFIIPNSVTSIGYGAFRNCSSLTSIEIPNSVTSIGERAFWGCNSLTSVTIGDGVTSIGDFAFLDCSSLTSITVDENNPNYKSIDGNLYTKDGKTLIQYAIGKTATEFIIPNSVTSIGLCAFYDCSSLTSIEIPNSVTSIGSNAFYDCSKLTSITIPNSVTSIGDFAFSFCDSLTSVIIGNSVTSIGFFAFQSCSSLTSVTIPNSVTSIGDYAFGGCSKLTSIVIPDSVTSIGENAFAGSYSLTIYCEAESKPSGWSSDWSCDCPVVWGYEG